MVYLRKSVQRNSSKAMADLCCTCQYERIRNLEHVFYERHSLVAVAKKTACCFPTWPINAGIEFLLDFLKVTVTAIVCLAPVIDC